MNKEITVKFTKHAIIKVGERKISLDALKRVVINPELVESDKFDDSLLHCISEVNSRFLRVIGKWESEVDFLVISAFFYRRLKRRRNK